MHGVVQCCRPHGVRDQSGKLFPGIEATNTSDKGGSPSQHRANQGPGHSKVIEGSWASIEWMNRMDLGRRTGKVGDQEEEAKRRTGVQTATVQVRPKSVFSNLCVKASPCTNLSV